MQMTAFKKNICLLVIKISLQIFTKLYTYVQAKNKTLRKYNNKAT